MLVEFIAMNEFEGVILRYTSRFIHFLLLLYICLIL